MSHRQPAPTDGLRDGPRFVVVHSPDEPRLGRVAYPEGGIVAFGREVEAPGVTLADRSISRLHLRCTWDSRMQGMRATDAGSRNGTFINGHRSESTLLNHGDVLRLGDSLVVYQESRPMAVLLGALDQVARSAHPVLLRGELGTGKEWVARELHQRSALGGPFIAMACGTMPPGELLESLLGEVEAHAGSTRAGVARGAEGGTLFVDDVASAPEDVQLALHRLLAERRVTPLGAPRALPVHTRLIAASPTDLRRAVVDGSFRADLCAGLSAHVLTVPPLRDRRDELLSLAQATAQAEGKPLRVSTDAAEALLCWGFPYNVRELRTLVRAFLAFGKSELDFSYLAQRHAPLAAQALQRKSAPAHPSSAPTRPLVPTLSETPHDSERLRSLLAAHAGDLTQVAKALGKPRTQVVRWMESLGLSAERFRR